MTGEPTPLDAADAPVATLLISVDALGSPSYRIAIHCGDEIGPAEAAELEHQLRWLLAVHDHMEAERAAIRGRAEQ